MLNSLESSLSSLCISAQFLLFARFFLCIVFKVRFALPGAPALGRARIEYQIRIALSSTFFGKFQKKRRTFSYPYKAFSASKIVRLLDGFWLLPGTIRSPLSGQTCPALHAAFRFPRSVDIRIQSQLRQFLLDRKSTRLNSSHPTTSRMPSSA